MPRLRNSVTGAVLHVSDELAGRLDARWVPADQQADKKPKPKRKK